MSPRSAPDLRDRAAGALWGHAIGDALGMPTQLLSRGEIARRYGEIAWFRAPSTQHPIAAGLAAGTVTDDTEQSVLLARRLLLGEPFDQQAWADDLLSWQSEKLAEGSVDLLGPSTRAALEALREGVPPSAAGRSGVTNGAAMRVVPVAVAMASGDLDRLVDRVVEVSVLTHNTSLALAGAAAIAAAVSACLDGATVREAVPAAVRAADLAARQGHWVAGADVARRVEWAVAEAQRVPAHDLVDFVADLVGTSLATQESVPAAFALATAFPDDPWRVVCTAASVGGDTDTIAALAGALAGSSLGVAAFPDAALETVRSVNQLDLDHLAGQLLELRCGS